MLLQLIFWFTASLLSSINTFNVNEAQELLSAVVKTHCKITPTVTINETCMTQIITAYFEHFDLCKGQFSSCEICKKQANYIATKILGNGTSTTFNVTTFPDIALMMSLAAADSAISCDTANNGSLNYYLTKANELAKLKPTVTGFVETLYNKQVNQINQSRFDKCINANTLASESEPKSLTQPDGYIKEVSAFLMLHQMAGYAVSTDCNKQPPYAFIIRSLYQFMGLPNTNTLIMESNFEKLLTTLKIGKNVSSTTSTTDDGHNHGVEAPKHFLFRRKRAITTKTECILTDNIYGSAKLDHEAGMTFEQFKIIAPILLQQSLTNSCVATATVTKPPTNAEKYGWGTLAVFIVTLCTVFGILIIPFGKKKYYDYVIVSLIGLGVGSLISDAILHLIPQVLGYHVDDPKVIGKLIGILLSLYTMYILENIFIIRSTKNVVEIEASGSETPSTSIETMTSKEEAAMKNKENSSKSNSTNSTDKAPFTAAIMVIAGDAIHNFADGLAIGAAFSASLKQGLALSIAVFCHELPHEFGDFAIMLSSGFSWRKALLANILSGLTAFVGLYIGLAISNDSTIVQQIILAVTAGIFIYVALTDMIPLMKEYTKSKRIGLFIVGCFGILLGFTVLALIAFYEEKIKV